jgi:hypothetical protein
MLFVYIISSLFLPDPVASSDATCSTMPDLIIKKFCLTEIHINVGEAIKVS